MQIKKFNFLLFMALAVIVNTLQVKAQSDSTQIKIEFLSNEVAELKRSMNTGGVQLQKYYTTYMTGLAIIGVGGFLSTIGATSGDEQKGTKTTPALIYTGLGISGVGMIISVIANVHVRNAGIRFQGNSIAIPIGK